MIAVIIGVPFSGKTTLLKKLKEKNIKVFHADSYITEIYQPRQIGYMTIKEELGEEYITPTGINRKAIKTEVEKNPKFLIRLNEVIHPIIKARLEGKDDYVAELPIITSSPIKFNYDKVILVKADPEILKQRISNKMNVENEVFIDYIISKWDNNIESDIVIDTTNDITEDQVNDLIKKLGL